MILAMTRLRVPHTVRTQSAHSPCPRSLQAENTFGLRSRRLDDPSGPVHQGIPRGRVLHALVLTLRCQQQ